MDAPLVLIPFINPKEVDKEAHNLSIMKDYPLNFYDATISGASPKDVDIETASTRIEEPKDVLEDIVQKAAVTIHEELKLSLSNLGISGSILWKGHNPSYSDINMNVYGFKESWILYDNYTKLENIWLLRVTCSGLWYLRFLKRSGIN